VEFLHRTWIDWALLPAAGPSCRLHTGGRVKVNDPAGRASPTDKLSVTVAGEVRKIIAQMADSLAERAWHLLKLATSRRDQAQFRFQVRSMERGLIAPT